MKSYTLPFLAASLVLACFVSLFASSSPDGLEKVAEEKGFGETATELWTKSPMPDYTLGSEASWETVLAGGVGTLATFALLMGGGKLIARREA